MEMTGFDKYVNASKTIAKNLLFYFLFFPILLSQIKIKYIKLNEAMMTVPCRMEKTHS